MSSTASSSCQRMPSRSTSTIVADKAGGCHDFTIEAYSRIKNLPTGASLKSGPFTIGGHRWRIAFFPNGHDGDESEYEGYPSLFLYLNEDTTGRVMAQCDFAFMVEKRRAPFFRKRMEKVLPNKLASVTRFESHTGSGFRMFIEENAVDFEKKFVSQGDSLTIRCDVVVLDELRPEETTAGDSAPSTFVPPSDLHRHLHDLLQSGKGADVVFQVGDETLPAHRCVLAARSPLFSAQFFGTTQEISTAPTGDVIRIDDGMVPQVFRELLCFLYTDSLPETEETRDEDEVAMYQHLLVAADKYSVERLKLICEDKLCKSIDVRTVATILTLAEQHHCAVLKKLCLDFLSTPANLKAVSWGKTDSRI